MKTVFVTPALFRNAAERYETRADKTWSLTDCASFALTEERGIVDALAFDQHFAQAGFTLLC
ncbi:MAG: hypothetical protein NTW86_16980 [Candidatus Sumerlaeota bacterium]|nr:hypothetical protein [Candidatus Sumerlaeota bacterium]